MTNYQAEIQKLFNKGDFKDLELLLNKLEIQFKDEIEDLIELRLVKSRHDVLIGKYEEALEKLDWVLEKTKVLKNDLIFIDAYLIRSEALHHLGKYERFAKEIKLIETKIKEFSKEEPYLLKRNAKLEKLKGIYYTTQGDYNNALEHLFKSEELYKKSNLDLEVANTLNSIAGIYWRKGESKNATEALNSAIKIFQELGNKKRLSFAINNLGIMNTQVGDYDYGIQNFKLALQMAIKNEDIQNQARCLGNLGQTYLKVGELDLAQKSFLQRISLNEQIGNKREIAHEYSNLGFLASSKGNFDEAVAYFKMGLEIFKSIGQEPLYLDSLVGIIIALIDSNLKDEVDKYRRDLEKLYHQHGTFKNQYLNEITIAYYLKKYGNEKDISKAKQIFFKIYENTEVEFDWRIFCVLNYSNTIIDNLKESDPQNILSEIKGLMLNVLTLAKSSVSFRIYAHTCLILAQIEMLENNHDQAREYLLKAESISSTKKLKILKKIQDYYLKIDYTEITFKPNDEVLEDLKTELKEMIKNRS